MWGGRARGPDGSHGAAASAARLRVAATNSRPPGRLGPDSEEGESVWGCVRRLKAPVGSIPTAALWFEKIYGGVRWNSE